MRLLGIFETVLLLLAGTADTAATEAGRFRSQISEWTTLPRLITVETGFTP